MIVILSWYLQNICIFNFGYCAFCLFFGNECHSKYERVCKSPIKRISIKLVFGWLKKISQNSYILINCGVFLCSQENTSSFNNGFYLFWQMNSSFYSLQFSIIVETWRGKKYTIDLELLILLYNKLISQSLEDQ